MLPNFIIIGGQKCGTTFLYRYLAEHPHIASATRKEVHFFDMHFDEGLDWYMNHWPGADDHAHLGEATPSYLYQPEAVERIAATLPSALLLVMLRNPMDRAYSHYWHNYSRGRETLSFAEAVAAEPDRIARGGEDRHVFSYVDRGRYGPQLDHLFRHVDEERVLVQTFEDRQLVLRVATSRRMPGRPSKWPASRACTAAATSATARHGRPPGFSLARSSSGSRPRRSRPGPGGRRARRPRRAPAPATPARTTPGG